MDREEHDELINLLRVTVPGVYVGNELAYVAYLQGHRHGTRRARMLTGTHLDIGAEIPAEFCGRKLAMDAWTAGQCAGYEREIELFETIDRDAIADWEKDVDAPKRFARGMVKPLALAILGLIVGLGLLLSLSGCDGRHGMPDVVQSSGDAEHTAAPAYTCKDGKCWRVKGTNQYVNHDGSLTPPVTVTITDPGPAETVTLPVPSEDDRK